MGITTWRLCQGGTRIPLGVEPGDQGHKGGSPRSKKGSRGIECSMIRNQHHYIRKIIGRIHFQCSLGESNFNSFSIHCVVWLGLGIEFSMILPTYPGKIPKRLPLSPKTEIPKQKLLVKGPFGIFQGYGGWDLRNIERLPPLTDQTPLSSLTTKTCAKGTGGAVGGPQLSWPMCHGGTVWAMSFGPKNQVFNSCEPSKLANSNELSRDIPYKLTKSGVQ